MIRDDDFGEVPSLGPAGDSVHRSAATRPAGRSPASAAAASAPRLTQAADGAVVQPAAGGHGVIYLLLILLVGAVAGLGYWFYDQQGQRSGDLAQLQQSLQIASQKIAVLESLISATDESASKSGAALQAQVRQLSQDKQARDTFVDSEIAKLWTVAYQRNKPQLEALEKSFKSSEEEQGKLGKALQQRTQELNMQSDKVAALETALAENRKTDKELVARLQDLANARQQLVEQMRLRDQAAQELSELQDAQLQRLQKTVQLLEQQPPVAAEVSQRLQEHQRSLESINAFRKQANQELLRLRERINDVQLNLAPSAPVTPGPAVKAPAAKSG